MKVKFILGFLLATHCAFAQQNFERKGFVFGVSMGVSAISLKSDAAGNRHQTGLSAPNIKLGKMLNSRSALLLLLPGSVYRYEWSGRVRDRGFEGIIPAFQYWAKDRWWLMGGAGLGMDAPAFYDIKDESERKFYFGGAAVVASGYEIWRKGRFALDVQARAHLGAIKAAEGRLHGAAFSLGIGVNWY